MSPASRPYPWKTFAFLSAAGTLTGPLVLPYFLGLAATAPVPPPPESMSMGMLVLAALARNLIMLV
ncbi:MAG TPA: hypothetical protein VLV54_22605, partial [Thermoanaerobaculia bacterium]|nr:hypothetical protein [Thermoanaerobaculia bacterium]